MESLNAIWVIVFIVAWPTLISAQEEEEEYVGQQQQEYWRQLGQIDLQAALNVRQNWNVAKNVIVFLGDGMGLPVVTAARIYKGQKQGRSGEEGYLTWEKFPNTALLKTYNTDRQVSDSAATATAIFSGVKANFKTVGVGPSVKMGDCAAASVPSSHLSSILQWAQDRGLDTGLVTTARVTEGTPAALYAHSADREWECDGNLGEKGRGCTDIAHQLITDNPGKGMKVILGGGRQPLGATDHPSADYEPCAKLDGRNLTEEWLAGKTEEGWRARYVITAEQLNGTEAEDVDYLLGLFHDDQFPYLLERERESDLPSLQDMTIKALQVLNKSQEGYFLMVEGGLIDKGLHMNSPYRALEETLELDNAVSAALKMVDLEETLVVVTADHSHVMNINGYPARGDDILGVSGKMSPVDGRNFSTLLFTSGPGFSFYTDGENVTREDPTPQDPRHLEFKAQSLVPLNSATHAGEDVPLWAAGPMSHLFHRTHEQHYVAHALAYAACVGQSVGRCGRPAHVTLTRPGTHARPAYLVNSSLPVRSDTHGSSIHDTHTTPTHPHTHTTPTHPDTHTTPTHPDTHTTPTHPHIHTTPTYPDTPATPTHHDNQTRPAHNSVPSDNITPNPSTPAQTDPTTHPSTEQTPAHPSDEGVDEGVTVNGLQYSTYDKGLQLYLEAWEDMLVRKVSVPAVIRLFGEASQEEEGEDSSSQ